MTKAVFNRSTRVARPKRTGRRFFARDPARRETLARRHHEIAHGNPSSNQRQRRGTVPLGHDRITSNRPCRYLFVFSPNSVQQFYNFFIIMRYVGPRKTCRAFSARNHANSLILTVCCSIERFHSIRKRPNGASSLLSRNVMAARRAASASAG